MKTYEVTEWWPVAVTTTVQAEDEDAAMDAVAAMGEPWLAMGNGGSDKLLSVAEPSAQSFAEPTEPLNDERWQADVREVTP